MKVIIKTLKAPWPEGAKLGDIVAFDGNTVPAWAVGKYMPALENAEADFYYEPKVMPGDGLGQILPTANSDEAKIAAALAAAEEQARRELNGRVVAAEQALAAAKTDLEASLAREAALQDKLTAAEQALAAKTEPKVAKK